jgi:N-acetylglucosaminyl-diphospho-decaprenol L-rhamnosyltransferase
MTTAQSTGTPDAMGDPLVSVVVVSWNTQSLLRECLASALVAAEELGRGVEVIVVDNASHDGSADMVESEFPTVRVIRNRTNAGFAAATNQGLRQSRGRYQLLLNPDTKASAAFLRILVEFLEGRPEAGAVGPRIVGKDGELQVSCFPLPTVGRELWRLHHLDRLYALAAYPQDVAGSHTPQRVESVQGSCMLLRREALQQIGLLDERFFIYTEEIDLCRRLVDGGWTIYWVPQANIVHYGAASTAQVGARMFLELYRSKVQYFRKHGGITGALAYKAVLLTATLPRVLLSPVMLALVPSRREACRGTLRNYVALLVQLPAL